MQEENRRTRRKTCGSKYGLETKCMCRAGTGDQTQAQWCTGLGKNRHATYFLGSLVPFYPVCFSSIYKGCKFSGNVLNSENFYWKWLDFRKFCAVQNNRSALSKGIFRAFWLLWLASDLSLTPYRWINTPINPYQYAEENTMLSIVFEIIKLF